MGEPQRSDAVESDRRSSPRYPADLLGKASVRLLGGSEVTLINFSERGILFQSETRLLVGARGTVRIIVGTETTIAAGTVVRSLVQGMASGKLAFHTALVLDQPLPLAVAVAARARAQAEATTSTPAAADPAAVPTGRTAVPSGKTIQKASQKKQAETLAPPVAPPAPPAEAPDPVADTVPGPAPAAAAVTVEPEPSPMVTESPAAPPAAPSSSGFGDTGFDSGSFGWADPLPEPAPAGLSVLFVSTTKERTSRLQGILASHRHDIVLTTVMHSKAEAIADIAPQHDVLLFDFSIGPEALERTLSALRTAPLGASIAILVPQQTALPPAVSSHANACVIETASGEMLVAALRDAAWTPWQPVVAQDQAGAPHGDLFWKAFDALPVPVLVVDAAGMILHANSACTKLADGVEIPGKSLASFFVPGHAQAITKLIADGFAGGYDDTPVLTAPAAGQTVQVVLQALSVLPGVGAQRQLAVRCELRAEAAAPEPPPPAGPDLAAEIAAVNASRDELAQIADTARSELTRLREQLEEVRGQANAVRRERDELRGRIEIAQRDLERSRELEQTGAAKLVELERVVAEAARAEVAAARAHGQLAATAEELSTVRNELDALRLRMTSQGADAERAAVRYAAIETSARQAADELTAARADVQRLTRERDQALAAVDAERARADAAVSAVREETRKPPKVVGEDAIAPATAKLQRQIDELRAEVKQEQDARKELEELLDQNAANLEQTIQDYEDRLDALGAGVEDKRPAPPQKTRQG